MNAYTNIGISAALVAMGAAGGYGSAVYLRPLQPPQQQAAAAAPPAPVPVDPHRVLVCVACRRARRKAGCVRRQPWCGAAGPGVRQRRAAPAPTLAMTGF